MAPAKPQVHPQSVMAALQVAVASAPDLSKEIEAVKAAQVVFDTIRQKAAEAHSYDYAAELNATHTELVAAHARHDVGSATDDELGAAKAAYIAAQEKADLAPGRRAVLLEELEKSREAIEVAVEVLYKAKAEWASSVTAAARAAEMEAVRLLVTASSALHIVDPEREWVGAAQILRNLPHYTSAFAGGGAIDVPPEVTEPDQIAYANMIFRRATRSLDYLPDGDPLTRALSSAREARLSPQEIEAARVAAMRQSSRGHAPIVSLPPQVGGGAAGVAIVNGSGKAPYNFG